MEKKIKFPTPHSTCILNNVSWSKTSKPNIFYTQILNIISASSKIMQPYYVPYLTTIPLVMWYRLNLVLKY